MRAQPGQTWAALQASLARIHQFDVDLGSKVETVLHSHSWSGANFEATPNSVVVATELQLIVTGVCTVSDFPSQTQNTNKQMRPMQNAAATTQPPTNDQAKPHACRS